MGSEITASEEYDAVYIHQRPYIDEILRHHGTSEVEQSPIQAPKELVTFTAHLRLWRVRIPGTKRR